MEIAKQLAGYTLGGADLLRRAMGKKIKAEMDAQREAFVAGRGRARHQIRARRHDLRRGGQVRVLRLQQEPCRRLRAARLPYRLAEGEPPGRVLRRRDDHGMRQPGEARGLPPGDAPARHPALSAGRQPFERAVPGRGRQRAAPASATRWRRSRAWERPRPTCWSRSARREGPFATSHDLMARLGTRVHQQAPAGESRPRRRSRHAGAEPPPRGRRRRRCSCATRRAGRARPRERPGQPVRRQRRGAGAATALAGGRGLAGTGAAADGVRRARALPLGPSARRLPQRAAAAGRHHRRPAARRSRGEGGRFKLAGVVASKQERVTERTRLVRLIVSDATAQFEITAFSELMGQARELLDGTRTALLRGRRPRRRRQSCG